MLGNTNHIQSDHGVKFDQAMEPAKEDRYRKEGGVRGVSNIMTKILAELADEHPYEKAVDSKVVLFFWPSLARLPEQPDESSIANECRR